MLLEDYPLMLRLGIDIGSTTLKYVVVDEQDKIIKKNYGRHFSKIGEKVLELLQEIEKEFPDEKNFNIKISGSAGMGFAVDMGIPFVQEVYATNLSVKKLLPNTDVVIELGGEDAKIIFVSGLFEVRMNGSCAGGTGAFIDQMATLLKITPTELNEEAKEFEKIYSIASRCGVFAKSDIQPLLNQGAAKKDISASIFYSVVNQTIAGLAQGREIKGNVVYLGGPLSFFSELRAAFDKTLDLKGVWPENSLYYVALGTAFSSEESQVSIAEFEEKLRNFHGNNNYESCPALFENEDELLAFRKRHRSGEELSFADVKGDCYIGVDAGSTTLKAVVLNCDEEIVYSKYMQNGGNPIPLVRDFLLDVYERFPGIHIAGFASTGYGEEIIKNAFHGDIGIVETIAHFTAAKKYNPDVDFIIDIGGQDIKCFKIRNGSIDNIFLNEACSSGCGSFLQTFAETLGYSIKDFANLGIMAQHPVDLGSRCTVFMNSSVKQAQKDGATVENISAGLSISVVKNALYKVIRATDAKSLGKHITVQGGTFLNDAVLRTFEREIGGEVVRPPVAELMGAFGAALFVKQNGNGNSTILSHNALRNFTHRAEAVTCKICQNRCKLTVNIFDDGRQFIGGNRCEKPLNLKNPDKKYNLYKYKRQLLLSYKETKGSRGSIGLPLVLNNYELLPFWHTFWKELDFSVVFTKPSTRAVYLKGQHTIPSDTVCYPAKIAHGHIEQLIEAKVDTIFYPCMSYNIDENLGDNNYNCPVVAYYPEVIGANVEALVGTRFIKDYVGIHRKKDFPKKMYELISKHFHGIVKKEVLQATEKAYAEYEKYLSDVRKEGAKYLEIAKRDNMPIIVLAGRPYHLDPEINHGIDKLICEQGAVVVSEEAVSYLMNKEPTRVLNQWSYHSRLYAAANYVANESYKDINLVQLVSFGCGLDAITTDETREILERKNKIYTQLKIDEITNLGVVKIRLRSLFAATRGV